MKIIVLGCLSYGLDNNSKILQLFPQDSKSLSWKETAAHWCSKLRKLRKLREFVKVTKLAGPLPEIIEVINITRENRLLYGAA